MYFGRMLPALATACFVAQALAGDVRVEGRFISTATSGPPLEVSSTDTVSDLSADKLDGFDVGDFAVEGSGVGVHYKNLIGVPGEEIDQDCAVNSGCFAGDTAGWPVTITEPGSYRLAGNLDVSGESNPEDVTAIEIQTSDVLLDLKGFAVLGPQTTGTGVGISQVLGEDKTAVLNGSVRGMGSHGIDIQGRSSVRGVHAIDNGGDGIGCVTTCTVHDNVSFGNGGDGIVAGTYSVVRDNAIRGNGGDGIEVAAGAVVIGNVASQNTGFGLNMRFSTAGYAENVMLNNSGGAVSSGTQIGQNLCAGSLC